MSWFKVDELFFSLGFCYPWSWLLPLQLPLLLEVLVKQRKPSSAPWKVNPICFQSCPSSHIQSHKVSRRNLFHRQNSCLKQIPHKADGDWGLQNPWIEAGSYRLKPRRTACAHIWRQPKPYSFPGLRLPSIPLHPGEYRRERIKNGWACPVDAANLGSRGPRRMPLLLESNAMWGNKQ